MKNDKLIYASDARKAVLKAAPHAAYCIDLIPHVATVVDTHGHWERNENGKIVCSRCKVEPLLDDFGFWCESNYCPNCGSKNN